MIADEVFNRLDKLLDTTIAKRVLSMPHLIYLDLQDNNISPNADEETKLAYIDKFMMSVDTFTEGLKDIKQYIRSMQTKFFASPEIRRLEI